MLKGSNVKHPMSTSTVTPHPPFKFFSKLYVFLWSLPLKDLFDQTTFSKGNIDNREKKKSEKMAIPPLVPKM